MSDRPLMVAVMGETASGKTALAETIADRLGAALLNADAFQVYRGLDIGTAKSPRKDEYRLMDIRNPDQSFGVGEFVRLASAELRALHAEGRHAVLVGGTGLYLRALFDRYQDLAPEPDQEVRAALRAKLKDHGLRSLAEELAKRAPSIAASTDLNNPHRVLRAMERLAGTTERLEVDYPEFKQAKFAISRPAAEINLRIEARTAQMLEGGWIEEVETLGKAGYRADAPGFRAHGYRAVWRYTEGEIGLDEVLATTIAEVKAYAKRQRTWMRKEQGLTMIPAGTEADLADRAMSALSFL